MPGLAVFSLGRSRVLLPNPEQSRLIRAYPAPNGGRRPKARNLPVCSDFLPRLTLAPPPRFTRERSLVRNQPRPSSPTPAAPRLRGPRPCCCSKYESNPLAVAHGPDRAINAAQSPRRSPVPWQWTRKDRDNTITSSEELLGFPAPSSPNWTPSPPCQRNMPSCPWYSLAIRNVVITDLDLRVDGLRGRSERPPAFPRLVAGLAPTPRSPATSPTPAALRLRGPRRRSMKPHHRGRSADLEIVQTAFA